MLGDTESGKIEQMMKAAKGSVARYDFATADKLNADQYRFIYNVFQQYADAVTTKLAPMLQSRVQLELGQISVATYADYLHSLPDPSTMVVFKIDPETKALLSLDFPLSFALLDKLMGGKGETSEGIREFTEIEMILLQKTIVRLVECYSEAWREVRDFKPQLVEIRLNPLGVVVAGSSENMVIVPFSARIAQAQGRFELCLPFKHLKAIVPNASFEQFILSKTSQAASGQTVSPLFAGKIESARVPISCELGRTEVLFEDLLHIEPGDCLVLDTQIGDPVRLKVNERTKFLGRPGKTKDNKVGIQICKVLTEGDEEFEE
ncbi:MAG: FliM/FliN family flagellar motor switch protein [bacterium]